eukprot:GHVT01059678.1.p2 GENE.GHVT01059678.1~~GHVT01059678.1.p2  ORF type:complete len:124 (+),score=9.75 GHVT01059678.1:1466-1837(+)
MFHDAEANVLCDAMGCKNKLNWKATKNVKWKDRSQWEQNEAGDTVDNGKEEGTYKCKTKQGNGGMIENKTKNSTEIKTNSCVKQPGHMQKKKENGYSQCPARNFSTAIVNLRAFLLFSELLVS